MELSEFLESDRARHSTQQKRARLRSTSVGGGGGGSPGGGGGSVVSAGGSVRASHPLATGHGPPNMRASALASSSYDRHDQGGYHAVSVGPMPTNLRNDMEYSRGGPAIGSGVRRQTNARGTAR
jgi:hypothetical protein